MGLGEVAGGDEGVGAEVEVGAGAGSTSLEIALGRTRIRPVVETIIESVAMIRKWHAEEVRRSVYNVERQVLQCNTTRMDIITQETIDKDSFSLGEYNVKMNLHLDVLRHVVNRYGRQSKQPSTTL